MARCREEDKTVRVASNDTARRDDEEAHARCYYEIVRGGSQNGIRSIGEGTGAQRRISDGKTKIREEDKSARRDEGRSCRRCCDKARPEKAIRLKDEKPLVVH